MRKLLVAALVIFGSCTTGYHCEGFFGDGFSEIITSQDSFIISFKGNQYTSPETALRYALLRASELTLQNGYQYFVVLDIQDRTTSYNYMTTRADGSGNSKTENRSKSLRTEFTETTYSGKVVKPATSIKIKCYLDKPESGDAINALFYWENNRPT